MNQQINRVATCCFTGPRPHKLPLLNERRSLRRDFLYEQILSEIVEHRKRYGCRTFLCGMARGADLMCAEAALELKEEFCASIELICVIPYLAQAQAWPQEERERYRSILSRADRSILLRREYTEGCLTARNRFMVEHSSRLIAVYDGASGGGTKYTIDYAHRRGLGITVIDPFLV